MDGVLPSSTGDVRRIAFHERTARRLIFRVEHRDAKSFVARFLCSASQNQLAGFDRVLERAK
jgi:hypothetical protein